MHKSADEIIKELADLVRDGWKHKDDPEMLSKALYDISALNWGLGQWQAEFEEAERAMKAELEVEKAQLTKDFVDAGDAVNKAEIKVTIQLSGKRKEYNKAASSLARVKISRESNEKVIDAARSRLSLIKKDSQ